jgi:protein SCO1
MSAVAGLSACRSADDSSGGSTETWLEAKPAPQLEGLGVREERPFRLADERGKVVVISFGYSSCAEICPQTFGKAKALFQAVGSSVDDVVFVYVTVDPDRDKPEALRAFLASVDPRFEGIYLEGDALASVLAAYHVSARKRLPDPAQYAERKSNPAGFYTMDHTAGFWLIDRKGRLRAHLEHGATAAALVEGVRRLREEPS